ncbi:Amidohydrolase [Vibrio aerogenes CECT 7868]|uniref:Amidohydrolase n=3 Tax=Vibrio aerogenes TaxID=92172 RepID=A0A1M5Z4K1_9VIBR|nr:Amidohydrolase [Vibrio aerogenes CECT 7868]
MKVIIPWTKNDKMHRYSAFIKAAYRETQEDNLLNLMGYYPQKTKFIILPMDMAYMGAGEVEEDIDQQHKELAKLAKSEIYKDILIPFAHIDPRRPLALDRLKSLIEENGFKGVKIYPTLGYRPDHPILMEYIYPYMSENNIPLLAHCSPGSVNSKKYKKEVAHSFADPDNYKEIMEVFPKLKVCLAHFGGISEWKRHLDEPRDISYPTWVKKIVDMIQSRNYPNLYTDISYTIFNFQENSSYLKILLQDKEILSHVLFGSDFYMVESEKYSEKRLSTELRVKLGEELFWTIASHNPRKFLY